MPETARSPRKSVVSADCETQTQLVKDRIEQLKAAAAPLEPDRQARQFWTDRIITHAQEFVESLPRRSVFQHVPGEGKGILSEGFSESPTEIGSLLSSLSKNVEEPGLKLGAPGFMGFIPISSLYPAALGDYLAAVLNPFSGNFFAAPGAVRLEHLLTRWMAGFIGYPQSCAGDLTSGGSISNLTAVVTAREARQLKPRDYEKAVVYVTCQTHHSLEKALRIAGMRHCVQRQVALDAGYRMRPDALDESIRTDQKAGLLPWTVIASAGSTDAGAVDPLKDIATVARNHGLWLHVDGAYGAMFALTDSGKVKLAGIERSDSLTLDPHKGLFMPCGSGAVLVRDGKNLVGAHGYEAAYMQDRPSLASLDEASPSELSPELTRPFRGLRLWLSLKLFGIAPFRAALEEKMLLARYFYEELQRAERFETGPAPDLSVVVFRYLPAKGDVEEFNRRLLRTLQYDGRIFLTSTRLDGKTWLRVAVLCAATHLEQIELALKILQEKARELETSR
jgi:aromatic-L-amino-acid decarboxylase